MNTLLSFSSSSLNRGAGNHLTTNTAMHSAWASTLAQSAVSDLVNHVLERSLILGCLTAPQPASTLLPRRSEGTAGLAAIASATAAQGVNGSTCPAIATSAQRIKKRREKYFVPCVEPQPLLKQIEAGTGVQRRDDCFFNAVQRMNKVNFTRREILEEVSPRVTIHPSIERTISSHE
jgi:hypothetical protein